MTDEYLKALRTQTLYLIDFETDIIIKSIPNDGYYMNLNLKESKHHGKVMSFFGLYTAAGSAVNTSIKRWAFML